MGTETGGESPPRDEETESGGDDTREQQAPGSLPLPPYPPNLGHPSLHVFRQMRDVLEFAERAPTRAT